MSRIGARRMDSITQLAVETVQQGAVVLTPEQTGDATLFRWGDEDVLEQANRVHPLALIARAFSLLDAISTRAVRDGVESSDILREISFALEILIKTGEFHTAGHFLSKLETMISPTEREQWSLSDLIKVDLA